MDDVRPFLRYISPGLVFILEAWFLVLLIAPDQSIRIAGAMGGDSSLGVAIGLIVASGGLGYVFSLIHHTDNWDRSEPTFNHAPSLNALRHSGALLVMELSANGELTPVSGDLDKQAAWIVLTTYWHPTTADGKALQGVQARANSLVDIAHGAGAALVACRAASIPALVVFVHALALDTSEPHLGIGAMLACVAFAWLHHYHLRAVFHTMHLAGSSIDAWAATSIVTTSFAHDAPVEIVIGPGCRRQAAA